MAGEADMTDGKLEYWFSPPGNDRTQQCDRSASPLSPETQNYRSTSQLESRAGP